MTTEYVNGLQLLATHVDEAADSELDAETNRQLLGQRTLGLLNNLVTRVDNTDHIVKALSETLLAKIMDTDSKLRADFVLEALKTLTEANNSSLSLLLKTLSPQKEGGEALINLFINNNMGGAAGSGAGAGNGAPVLGDTVKLSNVSAYVDVAQVVVQQAAKKRQMEQMAADAMALGGATGAGAGAVAVGADGAVQDAEVVG